MGTQRPAAPPPAPAATPVEGPALGAALRLFVGAFVVADKRDQLLTRLLARARRDGTLGTLPRWLARPGAPLAGADRSPAGLRARFGELVGVYLDDAGARRTVIAHALELGRGRAWLFVADTGRVALVAGADGAPHLCAPA